MRIVLIFLWISIPLMGGDHVGLYDRNVDAVKQKQKQLRDRCQTPEQPYYYAPQSAKPQPATREALPEISLDDLEDDEDDEG